MASDAPSANAAAGTSDDGCSTVVGCLVILWILALLPTAFVAGYRAATADGMSLLPAILSAAAITVLAAILLPGAVAAPFAWFAARASNPPESFWANLVPCWLLVHALLACAAVLGLVGWAIWRALFG